MKTKQIGLNLKQTTETIKNKEYTGNIFISFKYSNYDNTIYIKKKCGVIEEITIIKRRKRKRTENFFKYHERTCKKLNNNKKLFKTIEQNKKKFTGTMLINKYDYSFNDLL